MAGLKQKHAELEAELREQHNVVGNLQDEMKQLWRCDDETKELARSLVRDAMDRIHAEVGDMKEEMDHKFNLQVAENKRLQGHMSDLKKENKNLYAQVNSMNERLKNMEAELIGM